MSTTPELPDYNRVGAGLDLFIGCLQPVTDAMLERLRSSDHLAAGGTVLDLACGTGEPGLTLARRAARLSVLGVDAAPSVVAHARHRAEAAGVTNARFAVMRAEHLELPDGSVDGLLCRFGLMLLESPVEGARETARVLREGGPFCVAVWDDPERNVLFHAVHLALRDHLPPPLHLALDRGSRLAGRTALVELLRGAGLREVDTELFAWTWDFADFAAIWRLVEESGLCERQLAALTAAQREEAREKLRELVAPYEPPAGGAASHRIPHVCRLAWGTR